MKISDTSHKREIVFSLKEQELVLDPLKSFYWVDQQALVISDLHLGKAGHFRKNGVPVPRQIHTSDLSRLDRLIKKYTPEQIIFLGDLFHSEENLEWADFINWSVSHRHLKQVLVQGNHDILDSAAYERTRIEIISEWVEPPFHFTHAPAETTLYNVSGHIHPGVRLHGRARQGMRLPCFYFTDQQAILPAFGNFTGSYVLTPRKGDRIFALMEGAIIELMG